MSNNSNWPDCLADVKQLAQQLQILKSKNTTAQGLGDIWTFLVESETTFMQLMAAQQPPLDAPGDYEFGPLLYLLNVELPALGKAGEDILDVLRFFGLPDTQITPQLWQQYEAIVAAEGVVAADGSLLVEVDYAVVDFCWIIFVIEYVLLKVGEISKYKFGTTPITVTVPNTQASLTLALVGDWGTGIWQDGARPQAPAQQIMAQIQALQPLPDYIIHLGDVYYAGTQCEDQFIAPCEEKNNFVSLWQAGAKGTFALNSNHEMYNGGNGYFKDALGSSLFQAQQGTSYFALEFQDWLIFGLDSAYYDSSTFFLDGALTDTDQLGFINNFDLQGKNIMVMTHHNGLSVDGSATTALWTDMCNALGSAPQVWYWGHIHNGIVYSNQSAAGNTLARCAGHGAIPFGNAYALNNNGVPLDSIDYYASTPLPNPDQQQQNRVLNGFALVTLQAGSITEAYYEQGNTQAVWSKTTNF